MPHINDFQDLDAFLTYRFQASTGKALSNAHDTCSWEDLQTKMAQFIEKYRQISDFSKNIPLVLYGHKEIDFVVAIYACLQNHIPFIPVDNIYPESRLQHICQLSHARYVYRAANQTFEKQTDEEIELAEKDLAYIMFTSGTTGAPKGVQIGREAVFNLMKWMKTQLNLAQPNIFMNQAPFAFDLSMYEIFGNLAYGGSIVMNSREAIQNTGEWLDFLAKQAISTWVSTPSFAMQQILNPKLNQSTLPHLKEFLFCGEKLSKPVVNLIFQKFPNVRVINTYGPTEATVATTYVDITQAMLDAEEELPVGQAVLNAKLEIVDDEIWISGQHVMRGYLNNPTANEKSLIIHNEHERTYKTGDYGFEKNGMFYVQGRKDEQIKLNGYRIELSEIEEKIINLKAFHFDNVAVIALTRNTGAVLRLVCFYTAKQSADTQNIKTMLSETLPAYMMPSEFIHIDAIPVSTNHKVDKKALLNQYQQGI
ncbi:AMP-binding protein [Alysiella filiformis]|uniref:D-alanine--poly(Phosphoribitol) ligase subunit 1 n=1 Tax=Alysiella filiformis DSM 16848 TaxID=1120981 RepID=A0A286ECV1_9NEIS|nr:AMP-binding protein [Alysiella filiformis]QMT31898.1 AMP-binding protein [Alysiella filiformis]UBQ57196.1 AMP-binding protein [Alysiella filiformis DSM 16848]SOD68716.1 D-alanine--poly(phosphoribitol) ligase subunit 1 [Alysiella filiformis DSM 16848]